MIIRVKGVDDLCRCRKCVLQTSQDTLERGGWTVGGCAGGDVSLRILQDGKTGSDDENEQREWLCRSDKQVTEEIRSLHKPRLLSCSWRIFPAVAGFGNVRYALWYSRIA